VLGVWVGVVVGLGLGCCLRWVRVCVLFVLVGLGFGLGFMIRLG